MIIIIPDDYQSAVPTLNCFQKLQGHDVRVYQDTLKSVDELAERFAEAEALVLIRERTSITEELLTRLPNLRLISQTGGGIAHIDLNACERRGVTVTAGAGSPTAPAELTWGLVLSAMKYIPEQVENMRSGHWQTRLGANLHGRTLGIFGYGKIGSMVAEYGRAFGMRVLIWGREGSISRARENGFDTTARKSSLFEQSDVLCLHLRLTGETRGLVTKADLAGMKPTSLLVNTSRAELIEPGALVEGLKAGRPGFAAVDVYEDEPVTDHPLLHLDNALCTPHIGYVERDHYESYFGTAFDQVLAFAAGRPLGVIRGPVAT
ncbi:D-2-hydroxyacid dehydrogenase family protein [Marinobacter sp. M5B]|uniref:D-2-hydroxyacid dehydrogenase family protein n=1 Tax=Marinobacter sp. M5B TaxID=3141535 RepID=UPI0036D3C29D